MTLEILHKIVTMDVKSLYIDIPNSEGIAAVKNACDNYPK